MENTLNRLEDKIIKELSKVADKADMSPSELEMSCKAVCLLKELREYDQMRSMPGMYSEARGRDVITGRYISRSDGGISNGEYYIGDYGNAMPYNHSYPVSTPVVYGNSYSPKGNYSGHSVKDRMYMSFERMLGEAQNDQERKLIHDYMRKLEAE